LEFGVDSITVRRAEDLTDGRGKISLIEKPTAVTAKFEVQPCTDPFG